ncbi:MAG TPA: hypothetical protein VII95_06535 [Terriglobales bacterium]|jgi:hypothetical protein
MATHNVDVCESWNGSPGDQVNFSNSLKINCIVTQNGSNPWPFTDNSPIIVPPAGTTTYLKPAGQLPNGSYPYGVDCCPTQGLKIVTVP